MLHRRFKNDGIAVYKMTALQEAARDAVAKKIADKTYEMVEESCPFCGESKHVILSNKDMYGLPMIVAVCQSCDFVYAQKRMIDKSLIDFYDTEYRQLDRAVPGVEPFFALQQRKGKLLYDFLKNNNFLEKTLTEFDFIVEIGCGAGGILHYFRDKNYSTVGCDVGREYLNYGREKYGLTLIDGGLEELASFFEKPNRKPALVIYEQVLEHIFNLDDELVKLKKLIIPDSLLYIGVPGIRNLEHTRYECDLLPFLQIPHLVYFDLQSLQKLMHRHGFELLEGDELVRAVFQYKGDEIAPLKLKSNTPKIMTYLKKMEKKLAKSKAFNSIFLPFFGARK